MNNFNLKIAITAKPSIDLDRLEQRTAKNKGTDEDSNVEFEIDGKAHILTVENINEAFGNTLVDDES